MQDVELILASGSPRRRDLLHAMGLSITVHATNIDESQRKGESPEDYVCRLAREKAQAARTELDLEDLAIMTADTIVVHDEEVFGKPHDYADAQRIWARLSGTEHQVMTAVCLDVRGRLDLKLAVTNVTFGVISQQQMQRYWASGEPQDKAGAYGIQGLASAWVKLIHGSYSNVVGLPLREVNELLTRIDKNWL